MSFASLRTHVLLRSVGIAAAVALPLGVTAAASPASASPVPATAVATSVKPPTAAQVAAAKKAAAKKAAARKAAAAKAARGKKIVKTASHYKGRPYVYGATGPRAFDCSGYTRYIVSKAVHVSLPRTAQQQANSGKLAKVSKSKRAVGDLVFFRSGRSVVHVGIYAGGGTMWASPKTGSHVKKQKIWSSSVTYARVR